MGNTSISIEGTMGSAHISMDEIMDHVNMGADVMDIFKEEILKFGFREEADHGAYAPMGHLFRCQNQQAEGYYWIYGQKDLFNIKIHDFYFREEAFMSFQWYECLSITYYESLSGEEIMPYRRLTAGCVKAFIGGEKPYQAVFHKNIPIRSIGIEILPAYYKKYLNEAYPNEYTNPYKAFCSIDQTSDFPEMAALLKQVRDYRGTGMAAQLFYEGKVSEAVSLVVEYNRKRSLEKVSAVSGQDRYLIENAAAYINDHFNRNISVEHLARISCMGTTKFKTVFKSVYGCTITEYIKGRRMSHAENLLASTNFSIDQVAEAVGYGNSGRFAGIFRESTGLLPSEYRRMAKRKEAGGAEDGFLL